MCSIKTFADLMERTLITIFFSIVQKNRQFKFNSSQHQTALIKVNSFFIQLLPKKSPWIVQRPAWPSTRFKPKAAVLALGSYQTIASFLTPTDVEPVVPTVNQGGKYVRQDICS